MSTAALALLAAVAALVVASRRGDDRAPRPPRLRAAARRGPARDRRADGRARRRARDDGGADARGRAARRASSSRSGRRSTSTRCSPAAPRQPPRCTASPGRPSRSAWTACRSRPPRVSRRRRGARRGAGAVGGPPDGSRVRAVGISYHYPVDGAGEAAIRSAIAIPLENGARAPRLPDRVRLQRGASGDGQRLSDCCEAIAATRGPRSRRRGSARDGERPRWASTR